MQYKLQSLRAAQASMREFLSVRGLNAPAHKRQRTEAALEKVRETLPTRACVRACVLLSHGAVTRAVSCEKARGPPLQDP